MVQEDIAEVTKTLTPILSIVRQYLGEALCNNSTTLAGDITTQSCVGIVSDDLKGENSGTPAVALG